MITLTDMFCGCGGSSQGAIHVPGVQVEYALNHWKLAIDSHNTNHPKTHHDCADISETHPARYNRTTGLIASPECTNHSLAKGQRRKNLNQQEIFQNKAFDASAVRSRATMWDVPRFAEIHRYDFIITENVVDVRHWVMFDAWLKAMHSLGYLHECVYLNAMFAHNMDGVHFAPQSRDRIYIVFWKKGNRKPDLDIRPKAPCPKCGTVEAYQSWKNGRKAGKFKTQYLYRCSVCTAPVIPFYYAAINAIDFSIPMQRIGDRKSPLSAKTIARIEYGLEKFGPRPTVLDQANPSGNRVRSAEDDYLQTIVGRNASYLFSPFLFNMSYMHRYHNGHLRGLNDPFQTQTSQESVGLISPFIMANRAHATPKAFNDRIPTVTGRPNDLMMISGEPFLTVHRGNSKAKRGEDPITTQSQMITNGIVVPIHGTARAKELTDSLDTVMTTGHSSLITLPYHGNNQAYQITDPLSTIPTRDSISLVDSRPKVEDCYFRMLQPIETARAQGFPTDYVILGNKSEKQKQIGNANPPPTMELLVSRCVESLN